jgi:superfamily II DNA or RNA helicase
MPRIYDNIEQHLLEALRQTLKTATRADFCVGYFNLRGWRLIDSLMEAWQGDENGRCRLLIGMQEKPEDELRKLFSLKSGQEVDQGTVKRLQKQMAEEFRSQLLVGAPSNADEEGLRRLSRQLHEGKLVVKLFLRHKLHAKLYLFHSPDNYHTPIVGYMGSSNLTLAGLSQQGELNIDVLDNDACIKLASWFEDRWEDRWCIDISQELAAIIDESWAREQPLPPYYIYLKMAYHLSEEARTGLLEFRIPDIFHNRLFEYQVAAVKIAAHHLNSRGGVLIGDVVGLGKTLMATALARIMQDDYGTETLVLCPKNLMGMWRDYLHEYHLVGAVHSVTNVQHELPNLRRFRVVIIDESHNLRNREGSRYKVIKDYLEKNESKCILLTATPYNKTYLDLSAQLRLFLSDDQSKDLGIRPERLIKDLGESRFSAQFQCPVRSLTAFEHSDYPDDWRDLMRLFLVRRTRSFIQDNYALTDAEMGRKYLLFADGRRSYFPIRVPHTVKFSIEEQGDPYAVLYSEAVVEAVNALNLPRYGLGNYIAKKSGVPPTPTEKRQLDSLSHAGKRLMGFCRTNLFKRLESGGPAFLQSLERHILRNFVYLHAIENGLDLPIGTQDAELLDPGTNDEDENALVPDELDASGDERMTSRGREGRAMGDTRAMGVTRAMASVAPTLSEPEGDSEEGRGSEGRAMGDTRAMASIAPTLSEPDGDSEEGRGSEGRAMASIAPTLSAADVPDDEGRGDACHRPGNPHRPALRVPDGVGDALVVTDDNDASALINTSLSGEVAYRRRAAQVYQQYAGQYHKRFKWLRPTLFTAQLKRDLLADAHALLHVRQQCGTWNANADTKLSALIDLLQRQHPDEKVLVFTQFADTADYLTRQLKTRGMTALENVTGDSDDPTELAWRFSPVSNEKREQVKPYEELRVLISTDVLSEGQNLQDAHIVVNYDLPWAIIRLIQRAGRVDRIGQLSDTIHCYSFLPAEGVERLIRLRERVRERLAQNAEVVGTDEAFFEDEMSTRSLFDLYNEKTSILDGDGDSEVDLASQAYQIWKSATEANPKLKTIIERLPNVAFSTRAHHNSANAPEGALVYMRTGDGADALAWVNRVGENVTQSQLTILRAAACSIDEPAIPRPPEQHDLVKASAEQIVAAQSESRGGQLGGASSPRRRTYERLKQYADATRNTLFPPSPELLNAIKDIYDYPLRETARDTLGRQLRSGITDDQLVQLVVDLRAEDRLCLIQEYGEMQEPQIICSLGLFEANE